jgi:hypothetical protein
MARPRLAIDEDAVRQAYQGGISLAQLAADLEVDRSVVTRIVDEAGLRRDPFGNVITFPNNRPDSPPGTVEALDIVNATGLTYRQVDYWARTGLLHSLPRPAHATSGTPRYFPTSELSVAHLMHQLVNDGLLPKAAHDHARRLLERGTTAIGGITIHLPEDI